MTRVKMLTTAAGPNGTFISGSVAVVDDETAQAWVGGGYAVALDPAPAVATAEPAAEPDAEPEETEPPVDEPTEEDESTAEIPKSSPKRSRKQPE